MALVAAAFTLATGTGTGNLTRVEPSAFSGITPSAAVVWTVGRGDATDAVGSATHQRSIGFATGTASRVACGSYSLNGALDSNVGRAHRDDAVIVTLTNSGANAALDGLLDVAEWGAGGFTPAVDDAFAADTQIGGVLLGGADIANATIVTFQEPLATGDQDVTGVGFQPTHVVLVSIASTTAPPHVASDHGQLIFGASDATSNYVWAGAENDNQPAGATIRYCRAGEVFGSLTLSGPSGTARASCTAMLADGFRLNWTERSSTRYISALCLRVTSGRVQLFDTLTKTDGTPITVTATGLGTPVGGLVVSHHTSASTADTPQSHDSLSIGAFSSTTTRHAMAMWAENGVAAMETATAIEHDGVYARIASDDTLAGVMDVSSIAEDEVVFVMDDADPDQAFVWGVLFGTDPAGGGATDVFFENRHPIEWGMKPHTAAGLNGVLVA